MRRTLISGLVLVAAALGGCASQPAPIVAEPVADLDSLAYGDKPIHAAAFASTTNVYTLDSGDRLRVVVFGQEGLTNTYIVDAGGTITMPLIGSVPARGLSVAALSRAINAKLRNGFIRDPQVAVQIDTYRPFFILGEVTAPGQYPFVANMTVETAVAIAGGYTPRAYKDSVDISRPSAGRGVKFSVPPTTAVKPGDTITIEERFF